jgi:hypothetical protein
MVPTTTQQQQQQPPIGGRPVRTKLQQQIPLPTFTPFWISLAASSPSSFYSAASAPSTPSSATTVPSPFPPALPTYQRPTRHHQHQPRQHHQPQIPHHQSPLFSNHHYHQQATPPLTPLNNGRKRGRPTRESLHRATAIAAGHVSSSGDLAFHTYVGPAPNNQYQSKSFRKSDRKKVAQPHEALLRGYGYS